MQQPILIYHTTLIFKAITIVIVIKYIYIYIYIYIYHYTHYINYIHHYTCPESGIPQIRLERFYNP